LLVLSRYMRVDCVCNAKAILGEGPFWDVIDQRLYWVDIKGKLIHRFDPETGRDETWPTPEVIGSLAVRAKGGLIVALRSGLYFYDLISGETAPVALPSAHPSHNRFNDGKVDRQGRFWSGSMDDLEKEPSGGLFRLDTSLNCDQLVDQITISNSLCWSPDSRTLYYSDSPQRTVWAWDFEPDSGQISNRRVFIHLPSDDGVPDGATIDTEGYFWLSVWGSWEVRRYDPNGWLDRTVRMPVQQPTCPMFGGKNLDTIYVTSASKGLTEKQLSEQPQAGSLFAFEPGVKGLPEMRFQG
jgi:L-arabinonolactonase